MDKFKVGDRVKFTECFLKESWEENGIILEIFDEYDERWVLIERQGNKPAIIRSISQIWEW
jgi:hypothetical protein